jgi:diguanylate cyclase (GGDEF)-like protein
VHDTNASATRSALALAGRLLALADEPDERVLAAALAAEAAAALGVPGAALLLPALPGGAPRLVAADGSVRALDECPAGACGAGHVVVPAPAAARIVPGAASVSLVALPQAAGPARALVLPDAPYGAAGDAAAFAASAAAAFAQQASATARRREAEDAAALARAARTLHESLDLSTLLARICTEAASVIRSDVAVIYRLDGDALVIEAAPHLPPESIGWRMRATAGLTGRVQALGSPMMSSDYVTADIQPTGWPWRAAGSAMAVPIHWGGQLQGVLSVAYWEPTALDQRRLEALEAFAEIAGVAFGNASAHAGLALQALTDPLTGCLNHAALHDGLQREIERAERGLGSTLSLVLLDLDRFKAINDQHGHLIGDEVLRRVGHALRTTTRPYDLAARYGGDEFALIAVDADEEQAVQVAVRAIEHLASAVGELAEDGSLATAGVAQWSPGMTPGDLLARADRALLYGKRAHRRGEVLTAADLPDTFLPGRAKRRDRALHRPATAPVPTATGGGWRPAPDDQLRTRTRQLALANRLGTRLAAMTGVDAILAAVAEELHDAFGYHLCAINRVRPDGAIEMVAGAGPAFSLLAARHWTQPAQAGLVGQCVREGRARRVDDVAAEPAYTSTPETASTRSELVAPVIVDGEVWGVINLESTDAAAFDDDDVRLMETIAEQLAAALRSAALYAQLERAYTGTAAALAAALEAGDAGTAHRAAAFAELTEAVGRRLGLDAPAIRDVRLAATFHALGRPAAHGAGSPVAEEIVAACAALDARIPAGSATPPSAVGVLGVLAQEGGHDPAVLAALGDVVGGLRAG